MTAIRTYQRILKIIIAIFVPVIVCRCEYIKDDMSNCGIYLEFIYDYNMEYADAFGSQVPTVDVLIFDAEGKYLSTRSMRREELIGGKRMMLDNLANGKYKILTIGGFSESFLISDIEGKDLTPGKTTLEEVQIALKQDEQTISYEFEPLWISRIVEIDYRADLAVFPVYLVKDTKRFYLEIISQEGEESIRNDNQKYTFEIVAPEGTVYGYDNAPRSKETVLYTPYWSLTESKTDVLSASRLNTMRLLYTQGDHRIIVRNVQTGASLWNYDLMKLLEHTKPEKRPDGTELTMQEYLDRQSEWNIGILYKEISGNKDAEFTAIAIKINGWIIWLNDIDI